MTFRLSWPGRFPIPWDLSAFRCQTWVLCLDLLILFRRRWKVIISKSWLLPMFVPGKLRFEDGDHWIHACIFIIHDGERCKLSACHNLEGFQHIGIFQRFEVELEACAFWLADSFQTKVEGHHQQAMVSSNVCSCKTSCSGTVHPSSEALPD